MVKVEVWFSTINVNISKRLFVKDIKLVLFLSLDHNLFYIIYQKEKFEWYIMRVCIYAYIHNKAMNVI